MTDALSATRLSALTIGPNLRSVQEVLTLRTIGLALLIGSAICFANTYFGLQAGAVNAMPMQSSLLGFAILRSLQHHFSEPLSPTELTVLEVTAGALGLAPFSAGFISFIPALEFLPIDNGSAFTSFSIGELLLWALAICSLGIIVAAPFRHFFILRERLRFPSATATGTLIGVLFGKPEIVVRANQDEHIPSTAAPPRETESGISSSENDASHATPSSQPSTPDAIEHDLSSQNTTEAIRILLICFGGSALALATYFLPVLRNVPIFGTVAAENWLWAFDLSPAYFGYGIIIGPSINISMLFGAIIGWGILSPLAKNYGWAPGQVGDWDHGSRGWILWIGMGLILGDATIGLSWNIVKIVTPLLKRRITFFSPKLHNDNGEQEPLMDNASSSHHRSKTVDNLTDDDWPASSRVSNSLVLWTGSCLLAVFLLVLTVGFSHLVSLLGTVMALVLFPLAAFIAIRSLGHTDNGAGIAIGRLAQFLISLMDPSISAKFISSNLLLAGAVETVASQASQHIGGLKTAYMTRTPPRAVLYSQIIGTVAGTLVATLAYRLYTSTKKIPSSELGVPDAYVWLVAAKLFRQEGLPDAALEFAIAASVLGGILCVLKILGDKHWWKNWVPSPVAMAVGMYILPSITLARAFGSLILLFGQYRYAIPYFVFLCAATGFILGEGLFSIVGILLDLLHVPVLNK